MVQSKFEIPEHVGRLLLVVALLSGVATIATSVNLTRLDADDRDRVVARYRPQHAQSGETC